MMSDETKEEHQEREPGSWCYDQFKNYVNVGKIDCKNNVLKKICDNFHTFHSGYFVRIRYVENKLFDKTKMHPIYGIRRVGFYKTEKDEKTGIFNFEIRVGYSYGEVGIYMECTLSDKFYVKSIDVENENISENVAGFINDALGLNVPAIKSAGKR